MSTQIHCRHWQNYKLWYVISLSVDGLVNIARKDYSFKYIVFPHQNRIPVRGDPHILIVGDPGLGKSQVCLCFLCLTSRVSVEGKSSVCLICMKYRIIVLIIIIISLGQIILSYMANTSCTHVRTHTLARARTHRPTHPPPSPSRLSLLHGRCVPNHDEDTPSFQLFRWPWMAGRCFIEINSRVCEAVFEIVLDVFRV